MLTETNEGFAYKSQDIHLEVNTLSGLLYLALMLGMDLFYEPDVDIFTASFHYLMSKLGRNN